MQARDRLAAVGIECDGPHLGLDLLRLQQRVIDAIAPYTVTTGTVAAFASTEDGRDIQESLIDYVANFVGDSSGTNFNPHVTARCEQHAPTIRCSCR